MPKDEKYSNHPCHFLSLPSARRFWCRHCMSVFEDAITRWRHSRTCRYGVVSNFIKRRELEAKALQNTSKPDPIEARLEQSIDSPAIKPDEELSNVGSSSSDGINKDDKGSSSYRCFICQSQFSSMEEMRHHVKYPCNQKKNDIEDDQHAVTVYIDELTDRSRPWDPAPQPQQEEVYTSEYIPTLETSQAVHTNVEVEPVPEEPMITEQAPVKKQDNITPTNIYVNEQGETVIEVENLDLNSEGGELSLAHLLTQLSQQGIVFDKTKSGHMQARQEMTVSDPSSGKIYTTSTLEHSATVSGLKEEDEGQPTAEDAANTLAQLAGFRSFRNQELFDGAQIVHHQTTQPQVFETAQGYQITASLPGTAISAVPENQVEMKVGNEQSEDMDVKYEYQYIHPSANISSNNTTEHIALQTMVQSGDQEYEVLNNLPIHFYDDRSDTQEVTYITTTQEGQQSGVTTVETIQSNTIDVNGQRVIIDNCSNPVIIQQFNNSPSPQFVHLPVQLQANSNTEPQIITSSTQELFQSQHPTSQSVTVIRNSEDQEFVCEVPSRAKGFTKPIDRQPYDNVIAKSENEISNLTSDESIHNDSSTVSDNKEMEKQNKEFVMQTVSLQEMDEAESSNVTTFVDRNGIISSAENGVSNLEEKKINEIVENNQQAFQTQESQDKVIYHKEDNAHITDTVIHDHSEIVQKAEDDSHIVEMAVNHSRIIQEVDNNSQIQQIDENKNNKQIFQEVVVEKHDPELKNLSGQNVIEIEEHDDTDGNVVELDVNADTEGNIIQHDAIEDRTIIEHVDGDGNIIESNFHTEGNIIQHDVNREESDIHHDGVTEGHIVHHDIDSQETHQHVDAEAYVIERHVDVEGNVIEHHLDAEGNVIEHHIGENIIHHNINAQENHLHVDEEAYVFERHVDAEGNVIEHHVGTDGSVVEHHISTNRNVIEHHAGADGNIIEHHIGADRNDCNIIQHNVDPKENIIEHHVDAEGNIIHQMDVDGSIIQHNSETENHMSVVACEQQTSNLTFANEFTVSENSDSTLKQSLGVSNTVTTTVTPNQPMPIFIVSTEGLRLVSGSDPKNIVTQAHSGEKT